MALVPDWLDRQFDVPFRMEGAGVALMIALVATVSGLLLSPVLWLACALIAAVMMAPLPGLRGERFIADFYYEGQERHGLYFGFYRGRPNFAAVCVGQVMVFGWLFWLCLAFLFHFAGLGNLFEAAFAQSSNISVRKIVSFHVERDDIFSSLYQMSIMVGLFCFYFSSGLLIQYKKFFVRNMSKREFFQLLLICIFSFLLFLVSQLVVIHTEILFDDATHFLDEESGTDEYFLFSIPFSGGNIILGAMFSALLFLFISAIPTWIVSRIDGKSSPSV